ncbi:MAG: aryl-sulfate sulfotransferase [Bacteroidia bacterium]
MNKKLTILLAFFVLSQFPLSAQQWGDYTFYSLQNSTTGVLLDTNQAVFKTWNFTGKTGYASYVLPGGVVLRPVAKTGNSFTGGPICGQVQKVDWNGNIIWDYTYSTSTYCSHHDICGMPNGNVLLIAYELKSAAEVTAAGSNTSLIMWPDKIVEIKPTGLNSGEVVWEWHAWDHLVQDVNPNKANYYPAVKDHPELLNINYKTAKDWMHVNGIDYNPILDQIAFSSRTFSEWFIIDHSTTTQEAASHTGGNAGKGGDILFRWGNPSAWGQTGTAILNVSHDAHWIPEGVPNAGNLVGFNNGGTSSFSTVDQIKPLMNGYNYEREAGKAYGPTTFDLRHIANGKTTNMGNSYQLPNGNMLVCIALSGKIYEINAQGTQLWTKTLSGSLAQAFKYDTCHVKYPAPPIPTITNSQSVLVASDASSYQWYKNGTPIPGANAKTYAANTEGVYLVRTTDALGCKYSYSAGYKWSTGSTGFANVGLNQKPQMYPNPSTGFFTLDYPQLNEHTYEVSIIAIDGSIISTVKNINKFDLTGLTPGIYFVNLRIDGLGSASTKIVLQAN